MTDTVHNPLSLSDEDFAKLSSPEDVPSIEAEPTNEAPVASATGAEVVSEENITKPEEEGNESEAPKTEGTEAEAPVVEGENKGGRAQSGTESAEGGAAQPKAEEPKIEGAAETPKTEGAVPTTGSEPKVVSPEDHKTFYDKVMAPFTANGKKIELRTPEEAIQLMQQGANYTQKMQAIAPHRKMLTMAQNNGIDEDKLSFLIDLDKGNPEAIQKLLKDKNVDVLNIDTESDSTYLGGNHKVSDNEVAFNTNLSELSSTPEGKATIQTIDSTWDDASKEVLWTEPALMAAIHTQRENGIYGRITGEVDRRRMLGQITPETSFIDAYRIVGDDLNKSGGFNDLVPKAPKPVAPAPREPIATTAAAPKPVVDNGDKAGAASLQRSTPKTAKTIVNPLAMSDEDFAAQFSIMQNRL